MEAYINERAIEYKNFLSGKNVTVIGAGISNIPLIRFLLDCKAIVTVRDKKSREDLAVSLDISALEDEGVEFILGDGYLRDIFTDVVYKTPGIRYDNAEILAAYDNGAFITSEMEAFISICPAKIIAITGSNGKTTTSTLCAKLLSEAGHKVFLGGNIGKPLLCEIDNITCEDFVVLELSSFQLHTVNRFENAGLPFSHITFPNSAIITNVSPNHLDWHTSMQEYEESKRAVYDFIPKDGRFVTNLDCPITSEFAREATGRDVDTLTFSLTDKEDASIFCRDGKIIRRDGTKEQLLLDTDEILIPGNHNVANYMAAYLAVEPYINAEVLGTVAREFAGVSYRLELCREKDGIKFYDSSIDSSPSRTEATLACFEKRDEKNVIIILGGYDKKIPFDTLGKPVCDKVRAAFICGPTAKKIEEAIKSAENYDEENIKIVMCNDFDEAVNEACREAKSGDSVLLSPACASFDAFKNFEERGKRFKAIVNSL